MPLDLIIRKAAWICDNTAYDSHGGLYVIVKIWIKYLKWLVFPQKEVRTFLIGE